MTLKDEVMETLQKTSLKGVPRILTSKDHILSALWLISVLVFFGLCMYNVHLVISEYLSYASVHTSEQQRINLTSPEYAARFPNVLLCNTNPFSGNLSAYNEAGAILPSEYYQKVLNFTSCPSCGKGDEDMALQAMVLRPKGYYQYVGKDLASTIGHQGLVIDCKVIVLAGTATLGQPCLHANRSVKVTKVVHPDYFNCFLYEALERKVTIGSLDEVTIVGYSFILYFDNDIKNPNSLFNSGTFPPPGSGGIVSFVSPGHVPGIYESHLSISPGFATNMPFDISLRRRLQKPYSNRDCIVVGFRDGLPKTLNHTYSYSFRFCLAECVRAETARLCSCRDVDSLFYPETHELVHDYCDSMRNRTVEEFYNLNTCRKLHIGAMFRRCHGKCREPCEEIRYQVFPTSSKWPMMSQFGEFYKTITGDPYIKEKYQLYEYIFNALSKGENEALTDFELTTAFRVIREHFAQVNIFLRDSYYSIYEDKPKTTFAECLSQLGGTLNLWSGITVMIWIEVIDFAYRLCITNLRKGKFVKPFKERNSSPPQKTVGIQTENRKFL